MAWWGHFHFPSKYSMFLGLSAVFYLLVYVPITAPMDRDSGRGARGTLTDPYRGSTGKGLENELRLARKEIELLKYNVEMLEDKVQSNWFHLKDTFLLGWTNEKRGVKFSSLEGAKSECIKIDECQGVTLTEKKYELRKGTEVRQSSINEESWLKPVIPCVGLPVENALIDETALTNRYPILQTFRSLNDNHECRFKSPYTHLNNLLKFTKDVNFNVIHQPSPCGNRSDTRPLILFGIKSMPHTADMRRAIRETWLDKKYWDTLGINIHIVFLTGSIGSQLDDEIDTYDDILQINFTESHYLLPIKDIAFLDYIRDYCPQADFVFKGDDDILLVPDNIVTMIDQMKSENISSLGCTKEHEPVVRNPLSKYFVPEEIYKQDKYANYYSGAAYVVTGQLANQMAEKKLEVPIMPLDDCYIGSIINHIGKSNEMVRSDSICTGLRAFPGDIIKTWKGEIDQSDPCILSGLTVSHRFAQPDKVRKAFDQLRQPGLYERCKTSYNEAKIVKKFIEKGPGSSAVVFNEWKLYSDKFFDRSNSNHL